MIKIISEVGDGIGVSGNTHHSVHELEVTGEGANIRLVAFLFGSLEIKGRFLLGLNHAGTGEYAGMALRLPVGLDRLVPHLDYRIKNLLALVLTLCLAGGANDQVVRQIVGVLEDDLHLGVGLNAKGTDVILHLRPHG